jgi:hypothetical protein
LQNLEAERNMLMQEASQSASLQEKINELECENATLLEKLKVAESYEKKLVETERERDMLIDETAIIEDLNVKIQNMEKEQSELRDKVRAAEITEKKLTEVVQERDMLREKLHILPGLESRLAHLESDKDKLLDKAKTTTELEFHIHELEDKLALCHERDNLYQESMVRKKELEKELADMAEKAKFFARQEMEWRMEKESHVKLIKELTTWAKDLRGTLQEVEKAKEMDRANYRRQLESLKQDQERELAEARSQLTEARSQLNKLKSQQHASFLETKEANELLLLLRGEKENQGQKECHDGINIKVSKMKKIQKILVI